MQVTVDEPGHALYKGRQRTFKGKWHVQKRCSDHSLDHGFDLRCRGQKCSHSRTVAPKQSIEEHRKRQTSERPGECSFRGKEAAKPRKRRGNRLLPARLSSGRR